MNPLLSSLKLSNQSLSIMIGLNQGSLGTQLHTGFLLAVRAVPFAVPFRISAHPLAAFAHWVERSLLQVLRFIHRAHHRRPTVRASHPNKTRTLVQGVDSHLTKSWISYPETGGLEHIIIAFHILCFTLRTNNARSGFLAYQILNNTLLLGNIRLSLSGFYGSRTNSLRGAI